MKHHKLVAVFGAALHLLSFLGVATELIAAVLLLLAATLHALDQRRN